jgi:hypothetical protein
MYQCKRMDVDMGERGLNLHAWPYFCWRCCLEIEFCSVSSSNVILWGNSNRNDLCLQCSFYASACLPYFFKLHLNYTDILFDMFYSFCYFLILMGCKGTIPNWCQNVEVCLELHSCSSWACFHELFNILLDIPVYFNCCFGYGVGQKSAFSSRWFNQWTDRHLPLTLWLEFYMVIIMHACIHGKCSLYFYWSGKDQQSYCCRSGAILSVKSKAKNPQNKPQWAFSL